MNREWHERCVGIFSVIAVVCTVLGFIISTKQPFEMHSRIGVDQPSIFSQERDYRWLAVSDVVVSDHCVYAVYRHQNFIQAYDFDGNYLCTIAIRDWHKHNGALNVYAYENMLYLKSARSSDVYEFKDNVFVRYYGCTEEHAMDDFLRENKKYYQCTVDAEGREYYIDGVGISRRNPDGRTEVFVEKSLGLYLVTRLAVLLTWLPMLGFWGGDQIKYKRTAYQAK